MDHPIGIPLAMEWFCIIATLVALGVLPSIIAFRRGHTNRRAILALNILLGWTVIGWIVALVWSVTAFEKMSESTAPAISIRERGIVNVGRLANEILQSGSEPPGRVKSSMTSVRADQSPALQPIKRAAPIEVSERAGPHTEISDLTDTAAVQTSRFR